MSPEDSTTDMVWAVKVKDTPWAKTGHHVEYYHVDEDTTELGIQCPNCGAGFQDDTTPGVAIVAGGRSFRCGSCDAHYPVVLMPEHRVVF